MFTKKIVLIAAPLLAVVGIATVVVANQPSHNQVVQSVVEQSTPTNPQTDGQGNAVPTQAEDIPLESLVEITNPFTGDTSVGMSVVTSPDDDSAPLVSITDFNINIPQTVVLPNTLDNLGVDVTDIYSGQSVSVIHRYNFTADSSISWDPVPASANFKWLKHPSNIMVSTGNRAIVTYSSEDGGTTWVGSVEVL